MQNHPDPDYILCECDLESLKTFTEMIAARYDIKLTRPPGICMTMIRAEDSVEQQEFYLGEALTSECEVEIKDTKGYGICLGDEPERVYCMAIIEALMALKEENLASIQQFLDAQWKILQQAAQEEYTRIQRTKVDFKPMKGSMSD